MMCVWWRDQVRSQQALGGVWCRCAWTRLVRARARWLECGLAPVANPSPEALRERKCTKDRTRVSQTAARESAHCRKGILEWAARAGGEVVVRGARGGTAKKGVGKSGGAGPYIVGRLPGRAAESGLARGRRFIARSFCAKKRGPAAVMHSAPRRHTHRHTHPHTTFTSSLMHSLQPPSPCHAARRTSCPPRCSDVSAQMRRPRCLTSPSPSP
jgi:hypothetical protein